MSFKASSKGNSSKLMASEAKTSGGIKMLASESSESYFTMEQKYLQSNNKSKLSYISWNNLHLQNDAFYMIMGGAARTSQTSYQKALLGEGSYGKVFKAKLRTPTSSNVSSDQSSSCSSENKISTPAVSETDVAVKILFADKATFNMAKVKAKAKDELHILKVAQQESIYRAGFLKPYGMVVGCLSPQFAEILSRKETNNYSECLGIVTSLGGIELTDFLRYRKMINDQLKVEIMESIIRAITELHAIRK